MYDTSEEYMCTYDWISAAWLHKTTTRIRDIPAEWHLILKAFILYFLFPFTYFWTAASGWNFHITILLVMQSVVIKLLISPSLDQIIYSPLDYAVVLTNQVGTHYATHINWSILIKTTKMTISVWKMYRMRERVHFRNPIDTFHIISYC